MSSSTLLLSSSSSSSFDRWIENLCFYILVLHVLHEPARYTQSSRISLRQFVTEEGNPRGGRRQFATVATVGPYIFAIVRLSIDKII